MRNKKYRLNVRLSLAIALFAIAATTLFGCATSFDKRGMYHKVRSGDSIQRVARIYKVDLQKLAEYNNILDPNDIQPGMRLYIPPHKKREAFKKLSFGDDTRASVEQRRGKRRPEYANKIRTYRGRFLWPVNGKVTSAFGMRDGRRHDGVDISAKSGTPIKAAAEGRVVFAGSMRGYGNLILLRHKDNMFTAYSHNKVNSVRKGQTVKQGQVIAKVGRTGRASGPHVHFEIRHGQTARNPLFFLPERGYEYAKKSKQR
ncbi:MAG: peptidoglycan DD-metalloendopeptidase family protein [Pseudomonadota bacterium]